MKPVPDRRKNQQGDRIQNKNRAERYGHFFFIGSKNGADGGDGAAAANRRARGDQERRIAAYPQQFAKRQALEKSARNSAAFVDVRMRKAEPKENSNGESDGRGKQSRERKCETKNKNNFRERRHRLGREYQAGRRMGQQEGEKTLRRCRPSAVAKFRRASFFFLFGRSSGSSGRLGFRGRGL